MKKFDWTQWFLFLIGVVVLEGMILYLTIHAYPGVEMKVFMWGLFVMVVGFALYTTIKSNEPDDLLRQVGITCTAILTILGVASLYGHSSMARELSASREGYVEYQKKTVFDEQVKNQDAQRKIELAKAEGEKLIAQARLETAETGKLRLLPPSQRNVIRRQSPPVVQPTPSIIVSDGLAVDTAAIVTPKTESQVREDWLSYFQVVNMLQILFAVVGAAAVKYAKHWDKKGIIGVPDWIERVWHSGNAGQQHVRTHYPEYVQRIESALSPSGSQAYAGN